MAIQIDMTSSNFGVPFIGAYFRIVTAAISRQREDNPRHIVMLDVAGYVSKPDNEDSKEVDFRRYHAPLMEIESCDGDEFMAQCYSWLMTQPDMSDAKGV